MRLKRLTAFISLAILLLLWGCGGGSPPPELRTGAIEVNKLIPEVDILFERNSLGLVLNIFPLDDEESYAVVGHKESCRVNAAGAIDRCDPYHGSLGIRLPVSKDGYLSPLGEGAILADYNADGSIDRLEASDEGFRILSDKGVVLGQVVLAVDYWFEPAVSSTRPHNILVSTDGTLLVFGPTLKNELKFPTPGIKAPLHISDGIFLENEGRRLFVSVFKGRGGWHRTILFIHEMEGGLLYKEILVGDFPCLAPAPTETNKISFLLGGRGEVRKYTF